MKRGLGLGRSDGLNRTKAHSGYDYTKFHVGVLRLNGSGCWVARILTERPKAARSPLQSCDGRTDCHHLIPKRMLRREFQTALVLNALLEDARNGIPTCRRHHDQLESAAIKLARWELPVGVEQFAADVDLGWWLDRTFGERERAACRFPSLWGEAGP